MLPAWMAAGWLVGCAGWSSLAGWQATGTPGSERPWSVDGSISIAGALTPRNFQACKVGIGKVTSYEAERMHDYRDFKATRPQE